MEAGEITATSCGNGVVCPECAMTMYEIWEPPLARFVDAIRRVVQCMNRDCKLCGKNFKVKGPEVTLTPWAPVSSSETT